LINYRVHLSKKNNNYRAQLKINN